ncbi:MAG: ABC transporter permease [Candidatus Margulisiibacteriota bacterium]
MKQNLSQVFKDGYLKTMEQIGGVFLLFWEAASGILSKRADVRNSFDQMSRIGIDSIPVALTTAIFVGMVFAVQIANEFVKFGAGKMVGGVMALAVAREIAPVLTAVVIAGRVGASIAAELGTMKVTQQVDAINMLGTNHVRYLVIPRLIALSVMLPVLTLFADVIGFLGSFLVSVLLVGINPYGFLETAGAFLKTGDVVGGVFKAFVFGMIIASISCYKGLKAKNGAKGVGESTTSAVVSSLITVFIFNYFMSVMLFK